MLVVETIAKIRRAYFSQKKTIKEICRELRISRKVVRKVIRTEATEFRYERKRQPMPRLGPWRERLDGLLKANAQKAARERLTLIRIFEELEGLGFDGSYAAVRRYALRWGEEHSSATAPAFIPLSFAPGEAYQFDWSHEIVVLNGATVTLKVAHVRLCHSRLMFVRAYPRESQEMVFDAHDRAFAFFRGACQRGIYDNMKTAVETVFVGKDRQYNRRFLQMCSHYLVEPVACTPASGWEKGQVESQVGLVRERFFTPRLRFKRNPGIPLELRRPQRLAHRQVPRLGEVPSPSGAKPTHDLGGLRRGATEAHRLSRALRRIPQHAGVRVQDVPRALRQQPLFRQRQRRRPRGRVAGLRRPRRHSP